MTHHHGSRGSHPAGLGDLGAEQLLDLVAGHRGVLDDVVQPSDNHDLIITAVGSDTSSNPSGVPDVGLTGLVLLASARVASRSASSTIALIRTRSMRYRSGHGVGRPG
jgi:hypothetical protein